MQFPGLPASSLLVHPGCQTGLSLEELGEGGCTGKVQPVSNLIAHRTVGFQEDFRFLDRSPVDPVHDTLAAGFLDGGRQVVRCHVHLFCIERNGTLAGTVPVYQPFELYKQLVGACSVTAYYIFLLDVLDI